nr:DUF2382 domain-containing protein [Rubrobacter sp.]
MAEKRDDRIEEIENRYAGYQVYDSHYEKIGKVDDLFVDEHDSPEYIGVRTGLLGARATLIPMQVVRANDKRQLVEVAADREMIENAPNFEADDEVTLELEDRVCAYFGVERDADALRERSGYGSYYSGAPATEDRPDVDVEYGERSDTYEPQTPAGEVPVSLEREEAPASRERELSADERPEIPEPEVTVGGTGGEEIPEPAREEGAGRTGRAGEPEEELGSRAAGAPREPEGDDELRVQRTEEELRAGTREREAGSVNVRKRVRTERERVRVPKRREEVKVDRVPVSEESADIGEEEVRVPIIEEEVVVEK